MTNEKQSLQNNNNAVTGSAIKKRNHNFKLVNEAVAREKNEKVPVNSVPIDKTLANVGFNQIQYLENLNKPFWKAKVQEYFAPAFHRGFRITQPLDVNLEKNLIELLTKINALRLDFNKPIIVSSGYRSPEHNAKVGGATHSTHQTCQGIDIIDTDADLRRFCIANNNEILKKYNLFMEHPAYTKGWCHLQTRKPKSGNAVFIPYAGEPKAKHYDNSFKI